MKQQQPTDDIHALATLYALGALPPVLSTRFTAHLATGCVACGREVHAMTTVVSLLGYATTPVCPRPAVRDRLLAALQSKVPDVPGSIAPVEPPGRSPAWRIVRATDGMWEAEEVAGVRRKHLFLEPTTGHRLALVRLAGGARSLLLEHASAVELYVLEGDLTVAGQGLQAGDYCATLAGTGDGALSSTGGCMLLLDSAPHAIVETGARRAASPGVMCVRAAESAWQPSGIAGVELRPLRAEPTQKTMTALMRMQPGARLPRHRHVTPEQFYMLTGDGHVQGEELRAGDYYWAAADTVHDVTFTVGGCCFLLLASQVEVLA